MIKTIKLMAILTLIVVIFSNGNYIIAQSTIKSVKIGSQIWMAENLNVDRFRNGDPIQEAKTNEEWATAGKESKPAWCYFNKDQENRKMYDKLYNWYAVNDSRGLAPKGWHIPTKDEFEKLSAAVNNNANALKAIGQGTGIGAGTNTSGFSASLGWIRKYDGSFVYVDGLGGSTVFWSSTNYFAKVSYSLGLCGNNSNIDINTSFNGGGRSVRCIKD